MMRSRLSPTAAIAALCAVAAAGTGVGCKVEPGHAAPKPEIVSSTEATPAPAPSEEARHLEPWEPFDPVFKGCEGG